MASLPRALDASAILEPGPRAPTANVSPAPPPGSRSLVKRAALSAAFQGAVLARYRKPPKHFVSLYRDPVIGAVTSKSDWNITDLLDAERPVSLYLVIPPSDLSRTKPLMRLILNQIARRLTETLPNKNSRKLLFMLDEFPALERLDFFEEALAFMAGYGIRAFLIAQSLNQIEKAYGPNNSILDNCHVRVAFATNDERTAKRISDALGMKTELRSQKNYTGHRLAPWLSHMMVSRQETQRALLTPGEVMQLPADDEIVMVAGCPPIHAEKLQYFEDRNFTERVVPACPIPIVEDCRANAALGDKIYEITSATKETDYDNELEIALPKAQSQTAEVAKQDLDLKEDVSPDPMQNQHLDTVRRAHAMDRVDQDIVPSGMEP